MDFDAWKEAVYARLVGWRVRMQELEARSVYAFLSATALWPVVQAAQHGDLAALMALDSVAGGVGSNLIAGRIQAWKDRFRDEAGAVRGIAAELEAHPELHAELDAVLDRLDVLAQAGRVLSEEDRAWFAETLGAELARLGNLPRHIATLNDVSDTILVQGDGNVVIKGETAVHTATSDRDLYIGGTHTHHYDDAGRKRREAEEALRRYGAYVAGLCRPLPLRGLDKGHADAASQEANLTLDAVYVALNTTRTANAEEEDAPQRERQRPLRLLEAVVQNPRLVVLGPPGSGKSTFASHFALCCAAHHADPEAGWRRRLPDWPEELDVPIPIPVVLRDLARKLPRETGDAQPRHLWDFVVAWLEDRNLSAAAEVLHERLEEGGAVLLLDGLDEVPTKAQRSVVRDAVSAFLERYPGCRAVVTCRTLSYQDAAWQLKGIPTVELAPFDEEQIDRFIAAWYAELTRAARIGAEAATARTAELREALRRRRELWRLAENPLLLTVMALVHAHRGRLPEARALLYEETVQILLWRWEEVKTDEAQPTSRLRQLLSEVDRADVDLLRVLRRLAYEAHETGGSAAQEDVADIGELRLEKELAKLHPAGSRDWAQQVIEVMKLRAGLLVERAPEVYAFPHRTFQEYLAGAYLASQHDFATRAAGLVEAGALWREAILLAVGKLVYHDGDLDRPLLLARRLCPAGLPGDENGWRRVWLGGEVLLEMGLNRVQGDDLGREVLERMRGHLVTLLRGEHLSPRERAEAGTVLARLGDPRPEVTTVEAMAFCYVPAGVFQMGSPDADEWASDDEKPLHQVEIPYDYWIGRFPVTVAQWRAYVEASGTRPGDPDSLKGPDNHPVVWVSWNEAIAFCAWLTEQLRETAAARPAEVTDAETERALWEGLRDGRLRVTLPSEAEWEKAARGSGEARRYPWGDAYDPAYANCRETEIGMTSTIGCFPRGASPYGTEEMSGNVWEWTRSQWGAYPYPAAGTAGGAREDLRGDPFRVLRGGSFGIIQRDVRCAFRNDFSPDLRDDRGGFRVVVLPFSGLCITERT